MLGYISHVTCFISLGMFAACSGHKCVCRVIEQIPSFRLAVIPVDLTRDIYQRPSGLTYNICSLLNKNFEVNYRVLLS